MQSTILAALLRNKYDLGPTSTLIALKNSSGNLEWTNGVPFKNETNVYWVDTFNDFLPTDKCVHASLCNDSNPLRWHIADCNSLAPFLCQAQRCPTLWNLLNVNLSHIEPNDLFVNGDIKLHCFEKYSVERKSRSQNLRCKKGGVWDIEPKNCTLHDCSDFKYVPNSDRNVTSGSFYLDDTAEYVCKPGYYIDSVEGTVFKEKCNLEGWTWIGKAATCDGSFFYSFFF